MRLFLLLVLPVFSLQAQDARRRRTSSAWSRASGCRMRSANCGAGWERIIFDWSQHQPDGPDDWNTLNVDDRWLEAARACNREVVAIVKHTPAWATDGTPGVGVPRGLYLPSG